MASVVFENYTKKNGTALWRFKAQFGTVRNGKRLATTRSGFKSKREAKLVYEKLIASVHDGSANFIKGNTYRFPNFQTLFDSWWELYKPTISPSSERVITSLFDNHILPEFGEVKLDDITPAWIQTWLTRKAAEMASYDRLALFLSRVLKHAVRIDALAQNPFDHVVVPKRRKDRSIKKLSIKYWSVDQFKRFICGLETMRPINPLAFSYLWLVSFTGLRRGEALALRWSDIDWQHGTLNVHATVAVDRGRQYIDNPKTQAGNRLLTLDNATLNVLADWLNFGLANGEFIFITPRDGSDIPASLTTTETWFRQAEELANIRHVKGTGIHLLRHTFATLAIENGFTPKQVQYQLGHEHSTFTMEVYAHATAESAKDIGTKFAQTVAKLTVN